MKKTPTSLDVAMREGYLKYYDTAFWLRDERMLEERLSILNEDRVVFQEPIIELIPSYQNSSSIIEVTRKLGLNDNIAHTLGQILFHKDGDYHLRQHQAEALLISLSDNDSSRNPIITSGTGSGKTESFLLPIFARLLREAEHWPEQCQLNKWWDENYNRNEWEPLRKESGPGRDPAVRAMLLYPTNALVEDQITRLRSACIGLTSTNNRPTIFFGRYTGATLGSQKRPSRMRDSNVISTVRELRNIESELRGLHNPSPELISQFSDPSTGEMLTRWDMTAHPPDILITNTSMLNVMLMRDLEESIFNSTREWLSKSSENCFTLVVDELHSYRGTQGSEVALVVRSLLGRLGLEPDSSQLRCIATSASLDGASGLEYVEEFFGVDKKYFSIFPGKETAYKNTRKINLNEAERLVSELKGPDRKNTINWALETLKVDESIAATCYKDGVLKPACLSDISEKLFGFENSTLKIDALSSAFEVISERTNDLKIDRPRFRSHHFTRMIR